MTEQIEICISEQEDGSFACRHEGDVVGFGSSLPEAVATPAGRGIVATHWLPASEHAIPLAIDLPSVAA
jgi:hypothetical protein